MNNKLVLKNTLFLYFRLIVTLLIGLYTSRVILEKLGIVDYGLYNLVGGVVGIIGFMNSTLSSATSRFLNIEMINEDITKLNKVFNSSFLIHFFLAVIILIIAETIGLWFFYNKIKIPLERLDAALIVYQLSILTIIINIIRLPYEAIIIAYEKMSIFAYLSLGEVIVKLLIVYLLDYFKFDKLVLYSILLLFMNLIVSVFYKIYCNYTFKGSKINNNYDIIVIKKILSFFSWDLYGNFSIVIRNQGIIILQNNFFGLAINTATTISMQVLSGISGFSNNFLIAIKPSLIKEYAKNNIKEMEKIVINGSIMSYYLMLIFSLPLILNIDFILKIWLKNVPKYTNIFCQIALISNMISVMFRTLMFTIHATGKMKRISFLNGSIYLLVIPISYYFLIHGATAIVAPILNGILLLIGCIINLYTVKKYISNFNVKNFLIKAVFKPLLITLIMLLIPLYHKLNTKENLINFLFSIVICTTTILIIIYNFGIEKVLQDKIKNKINNLIK